jgi:hypothetical protein
LIGASGFFSGLCCSRLQVMGLMRSQSSLLSFGQQRTVVLPARAMQRSSVRQQKPVGREDGQADWAAGQMFVSVSWRVKRDDVGMAVVTEERRRRLSGRCKRPIVMVLL